MYIRIQQQLMKKRRHGFKKSKEESIWEGLEGVKGANK